MTDSNVVFNEERTYLALVKVEADSIDHAETLVTGALSASFARGDFPTTFDVLCAVEDGGVPAQALEDLADELLYDDDDGSVDYAERRLLDDDGSR